MKRKDLGASLAFVSSVTLGWNYVLENIFFHVSDEFSDSTISKIWTSYLVTLKKRGSYIHNE